MPLFMHVYIICVDCPTVQYKPVECMTQNAGLFEAMMSLV